MPSPQVIAFAKAVSRISGWIYFTSWSLSFYPQPLLNYRRHSTAGFSPDYAFSNVLGFSALLASTSALLFSPTIRAEYAARHPRAPEPTVRWNDWAFAAHAVVWTIITASQFWPRMWGWEGRGKREGVGGPESAGEAVEGGEEGEAEEGEKSSMLMRILCGGGILAILILSIIVLISQHSAPNTTPSTTPTTITILTLSPPSQPPSRPSQPWAYLDIIYSLQYLKLLLTLYKYIPQVLTNHARRSTLGFSIGTILCDATGGVLSLLQLAIDSALTDDARAGVSGNPVKVGLGLITLFYDGVFLVQHYVLYRGEEGGESVRVKKDDERTALLNGRSGQGGSGGQERENV